MKLKRFHKDVYCPTWTWDSINLFCNGLKGIKLQHSYHSLNKLKKLRRKQKRAVEKLLENLDISDSIYLDYVFEFYANKDNEVKKVCFRFPMKDLDHDIILVISHLGKIVTIYLNDNFDSHPMLDKYLYEQGEKENVEHNVYASN